MKPAYILQLPILWTSLGWCGHVRNQFVIPETRPPLTSSYTIVALDASIKWEISQEVTIKWDVDFPSMTLQLLQPDNDGTLHRKEYFANRPNDGNLTFTWIVETIAFGSNREMSFEIFNASDSENSTPATVASKHFRVRDQPGMIVMSNAGSKNTLTLNSPGDTIVEGPAATSIPTPSASDGSHNWLPEIDKNVIMDYETALRNARDETARVGLAVGLGLGLPLVVLVVLVALLLMRLHHKSKVVVNEAFVHIPEKSTSKINELEGWRKEFTFYK